MVKSRTTAAPAGRGGNPTPGLRPATEASSESTCTGPPTANAMSPGVRGRCHHAEVDPLDPIALGRVPAGRSRCLRPKAAPSGCSMSCARTEPLVVRHVSTLGLSGS